MSTEKEKDWTDDYLQELIKLNHILQTVHPENKVYRIELLSKQLVFIGKLAAEASERYKRVYATRKRVHAETYLNSPKNKAPLAELAIVDLREEEAEAYGDMTRWKNAFESTREEINAIKYRIRIDIEDGSSKR